VGVALEVFRYGYFLAFIGSTRNYWIKKIIGNKKEI
jgi:hypothetical protein